MTHVKKPKRGRPGLKERLRHGLEEFFTERLGESRALDVQLVDDLILLRCRGALSSSEVNLGTLKAGRLLLWELNERLCQDLKPALERLLRRITGLRLVDISVGLLPARRERIYLLTMSQALERRAPAVDGKRERPEWKNGRLSC